MLYTREVRACRGVLEAKEVRRTGKRSLEDGLDMLHITAGEGLTG